MIFNFNLNPIVLSIAILSLLGAPINLGRRNEIAVYTLPKLIDNNKSINYMIDEHGNVLHRRATTLKHVTWPERFSNNESINVFRSKTGKDDANSHNQRRSQEIGFNANGLVINKDNSVNLASSEAGNIKRRSQVLTFDMDGMTINSDKSINLAKNSVANVESPVPRNRRSQKGTFDNSNSVINMDSSINVGKNRIGNGNRNGNEVTIRNLDRRGQSFVTESNYSAEIDRSINNYVANYGVTDNKPAVPKRRRDQKFGITSNNNYQIDESLNSVTANIGAPASSKRRRDQSLDDLATTYRLMLNKDTNITKMKVAPNAAKSRRNQVVSVDHAGSITNHDRSTNIMSNEYGNSESDNREVMVNSN